MQRRTFLQVGSLAVAGGWQARLHAAIDQHQFDAAAKMLEMAADSGKVSAGALLVQQGSRQFTRTFGKAESPDAIFLLASISKPMTVAALMTLFDEGKFQLDDPVQKHLPEFKGEGRERVQVRHLLTHVSGLPDQLARNKQLRMSHAPQSEFVRQAMKTPLLFAPATKYSYSSMGILLASEIAHRMSGMDFLAFINKRVFGRLGMKHSALGLGSFKLAEVIRCQTASAAPESGAGDPTTTDWDWNSTYWRRFGAPWGGAHASVGDVQKFLHEFLHPSGKLLRPETAKLMITNHNAEGLRSRGLGFAVGTWAGGKGCSPQTFGHTGSTGTLAWSDPATDTTCIVLTTLPGSVPNHPRQAISDLVAQVAVRNE